MTSSTKTNPVIFIHGLWIHASAWQPWMDLFTERGYDVSAPGWPGDADTVTATRENADALNDSASSHVVDHYAQLIGRRRRETRIQADHRRSLLRRTHRPGTRCRRCRRRSGHRSRADQRREVPAAGPTALPFPVLRNPATPPHRRADAQAVSLRVRQRAQRRRIRRLHASGRFPAPAARCSRTPPPTSSGTHPRGGHAPGGRGPLLLTSGTEDHTVPLKVTKEYSAFTPKARPTPSSTNSGRGHSLTIDGGWKDVAETTVKWFDSKGF